MIALLLHFLFFQTPVIPPGTHEVYTTPDGQFLLVADDGLKVNNPEKIAARVAAAYSWLKQTQRWPDPARVDRPLRVHLRETPGLLGIAGGGSFSINISYLKSNVALSSGTLAHELCHIQDNRELGKGRLPGFLTEGRGLTNGFMYRKSLGYPPQPYDRSLARGLLTYNRQQVVTVVTRLEPGDLKDHTENGIMEDIGAWFVEYLRTSFDGNGFPDVQPRLARTIDGLHDGQNFEAAFQTAFGVPFATVQKAFIQHAALVRGPDRLKKTMWAGLAPGPVRPVREPRVVVRAIR
jgi:hypothetical protein